MIAFSNYSLYDGSETKGVPRISSEDVALDERPGWAREYSLSRPRIRRILDVGAPESLPDVVWALSEIVEVEGPISQELALGRLKDAAGVSRAGRRIRAVFDAAVDTLRKRGAIRVDRGRFLWSATSTAGTVVRTPAEEAPGTVRNVSDLPQEEIRLAVIGLLRDAITAEPDELAARTARLFGWSRRGSDIGLALEQVVKALVKEKLVTREGQLLRLVSRDRSG